jgi:hypothetical protein
MKLTDDGIPLLEEKADVRRLDAFLDRLTDAMYWRLPRYVRWVLPRDALRALLGLGADSLAPRAGL